MSIVRTALQLVAAMSFLYAAALQVYFNWAGAVAWIAAFVVLCAVTGQLVRQPGPRRFTPGDVTFSLGVRAGFAAFLVLFGMQYSRDLPGLPEWARSPIGIVMLIGAAYALWGFVETTWKSIPPAKDRQADSYDGDADPELLRASEANGNA